MNFGPETNNQADNSNVAQTVTDGGTAVYTRGKGAATVFGDFFKLGKGAKLNYTATVSSRGADGESSFLADAVFGQGAAGSGAATRSSFQWSPLTIGVIGAVLLGVFFLLKKKS